MSDNYSRQFSNIYELDMLMYPYSSGFKSYGWRPMEQSELTFRDGAGFRKAFSGVEYTMQWDASYGVNVVYLDPKHLPRTDSTATYEQIRGAVSANVDVVGESIESLERRVEALVERYKALANPVRKRKSEATKSLRAASEWGGHYGPEAIQAWRDEIKEWVAKTLDGQAERYNGLHKYYREHHMEFREPLPAMTTAELFLYIVSRDTGSYELHWPTGFDRTSASRAFRKILDDMEEQKRIVKHSERWGDVRWVSGLL